MAVNDPYSLDCGTAEQRSSGQQEELEETHKSVPGPWWWNKPVRNCQLALLDL